MITVTASTGKSKTVAIKPEDLITQSLAQVISDKVGEDISHDDIVSFDGKKAVINIGTSVDVNIDEEELIHESIESVVKKRLKTRKKLTIKIKKGSVGKK